MFLREPLRKPADYLGPRRSAETSAAESMNSLRILGWSRFAYGTRDSLRLACEPKLTLRPSSVSEGW
jgi:hypothetical protein